MTGESRSYRYNDEFKTEGDTSPDVLHGIISKKLVPTSARVQIGLPTSVRVQIGLPPHVHSYSLMQTGAVSSMGVVTTADIVDGVLTIKVQTGNERRAMEGL